MVEKFGYLFDQHRKEQKIVLAEEARLAAEVIDTMVPAVGDDADAPYQQAEDPAQKKV